MLRFLDITQIGSAATAGQFSGLEGGPPAGPPQFAGGPRNVVPERDHPGPQTGPPPTDKEGLTAPPSRLDIEPDRLKTLDRVLTARAGQIGRDAIQEFRALVVHTAAKLRRVYDRPPDNDSMAALVQACDGRRDTLNWLMLEMHRENRTPGESPMWWTAVALQRIHGISSKAQAIRRAELRQVNRPIAVDAGTPTEEEEMETADFEAAILKLALAKGGTR